MRNLRATGIFISTAATCLLIFSLETASAKERPSIGQAAPAVHPLPRFDAMVAALQNPPTKPHPAKTSQIPLPAGDGLDTTKKLCSTCHGTDVFAKQRHTKEKWNQIIDNMVSKGMEASDDDLEKMADYLGANLGPDSPAPTPAGQPAPSEPASGQPAPKPSPQS